MKRGAFVIISMVVLVAIPGWGAALGTAAGTVIPSQVQQIITVDYRQLAASPTALALKAKVLPDSLKNLETAESIIPPPLTPAPVVYWTCAVSRCR